MSVFSIWNDYRTKRTGGKLPVKAKNAFRALQVFMAAATKVPGFVTRIRAVRHVSGYKPAALRARSETA